MTLMFLFLNMLYHKTYVDNAYFISYSLYLKESFKVLRHFHVRPKPEYFRRVGSYLRSQR